MMEAIGLQAVLEMTGFNKGASQYMGTVGKMEGSTDSLAGKLGSLGKGVLKVGAVIGGAALGGFAALTGVIASTIGPASDLNESMSKVTVVFAENADEMIKWSQTAATSMGLSQQKALEASGTYGNLFRAMGLSGDAATMMSKDMVQLAADLGSFNNIPIDEALEKLRAGLTGEAEPLKALGINMNEATLKAKALEMGLIKSTKEALEPAAKAQAAYALIMEQSTLAQGDFARTAGGLANQQKIVAAQIEDLRAKIGTAFLPIITKLTGKFSEIVSKYGPQITSFFEKVATYVGGAVEVFLNFITRVDDLTWAWDDLAMAVEGTPFEFLQSGLNKIEPIWRALVTFIQESIIPAFQVVTAWLGENIPIAIQAVAGFWESTLYPALQTVWGFIVDNVIPAVGEIVKWLGENIPKAIGIAKDFFENTMLPILRTVWTFVQESILPVFRTVVEWLANFVPVAIDTLAVFFREHLMPAIEAVWLFIDTEVLPLLRDLWAWIGENLPIVLEKLAGFWTNTLMPALEDVADFVVTDIVPALYDIWNWLEVNIPKAIDKATEVFNWLKDNVFTPVVNFIEDPLIPTISKVVAWLKEEIPKAVDKVTEAFGWVKDHILQPVADAFGKISEAVGWVIDKIKEVIDWFNQVGDSLPDWLIPGSPTPFELGIRGINDAMRQLAKQGLPEMTLGFREPAFATAGSNSVVNNNNRVVNLTMPTTVNNGMDAAAFQASVLRIIKQEIQYG